MRGREQRKATGGLRLFTRRRVRDGGGVEDADKKRVAGQASDALRHRAVLDCDPLSPILLKVLSIPHFEHRIEIPAFAMAEYRDWPRELIVAVSADPECRGPARQ